MGAGTRGCVERATPAKIAAVERQREALALRKAGTTFQSIADTLGYGNRSSAADAVTKALRETIPQEEADELRRLENVRLDALFEPMYAQAVEGDGLAVDRCLRIMERRANLSGLDAPIRVRQAVITEDDLDRGIAKIEAETEALESRASPDAEQEQDWATSWIVLPCVDTASLSARGRE
jgi:hypothetical protein